MVGAVVVVDEVAVEELAAEEELREGERLVELVVEAQVAVAGSQPRQGHHALRRHRIARHVHHLKKEDCKCL